MASDQEVRTLLTQLQQAEVEARAYERQMEVVSFTINEIDNAVTAIEALKKPDVGKEALIPIGANSFVYGTVPQTNRVIIGLGANVSAEVDVTNAVSYLSERKKKLTEIQQQFATRLNQIGSQIYALQAKLQAVQSESQAAQ
ncbi:MAG TPA: prefoldin subunit alpha [Candidatus Acidoferrales bacterium]|nr:prefoldin subunit alpha [Candidatus Acidoferrales bacterium]